MRDLNKRLVQICLICFILNLCIFNLSQVFATEDIIEENEINQDVESEKFKIIVKIGEEETGVNDLKEAIESASTTEETLIILNDNIEIKEQISIKQNTNVVIDGVSKYIISRGEVSEGKKYTKSFFVVADQAKLTLKNLTIDSGNNYVFDKTGYQEALETVNTKITDVHKFITSETNGVLTTDWGIKVSGEAYVYNTNFKNLYSKNGVGTFYGQKGAKIIFEDSSITHSASSGGGVAFSITGADSKTIINGNSKIDDNFAGSNGGIFKIYNSAILEVNNGEITNNRAINSNGVVSMTYQPGSTFILNGGLIKNNCGIVGTSNGRNGMIYIHSGSKFIMNGGTIEENRGQGYGGIDAPGHATSSLELNAGTIKNNKNNGNAISKSDICIATDYDIELGEGMYVEGYIYVAGDITNNGTIKGWLVTDLKKNVNEVAYRGTGTIDGDLIVYHNEGEEPKVENKENILGDAVFCGPTEVLTAVLFTNQPNEKGRTYELHAVEKDAYLDIPDAAKKGHSIEDYYTDENLDNVLDTPITGITILYTEFVPNKHTVTWEIDGEKVEIETTYGEKIESPIEPVKEGYTFVGWTEYTDGMTLDDSDERFTAIWKINEYKVKFMTNDEEVYQELIVEYNSQISKPEDPIKDGAVFEGWYKDSRYTEQYDFNTPAKGDINLYAKWKELPAEDTGLNNPKTDDDIMIHIKIFFISLTIIISILIIKNKNV